MTAPAKFRAAVAQLSMPIDDSRPEKVRVAARYIAKWGTPGVKLSPRQRDTLAQMRETMRKWVLEQEREAQAEKSQAEEADHADQ